MSDDTIYRLLCRHVGLALIVTDTEFLIRVWNPAAERIFNASGEQMIGTPLLNVVPEDYQSLALRLFHRTVLNAEMTEFEIPYRDACGHHLFLAVTLSPLFDDAGVRIGICAGVRDITRRVAAEKEIAAGQTMTALGALCGGVAHHFNNLLGGIGTSVDFALTTADAGATRRALKLTAESVARAAKITRSLLTFAKSQPQDDERIELTRVVRQWALEQRSPLELRKIHLVFDYRPIPVLFVPSRQVRTLLEEVTANAVEAMPAGGELWIRLFPSEREILLAFEDTGVGIAPGHLDRIFEPFFTTKGELAGGPGGHVGLGLAVVHGVVRELGGTVTTQSQQGRGTRLEIRLPFPPSVRS
jgi:PAS domain S-box-containing protein